MVDSFLDEISVANRAKIGIRQPTISGVKPVGKDPRNVVSVRDSEDQRFFGIEEIRVVARHLTRALLSPRSGREPAVSVPEPSVLVQSQQMYGNTQDRRNAHE